MNNEEKNRHAKKVLQSTKLHEMIVEQLDDMKTDKKELGKILKVADIGDKGEINKKDKDKRGKNKVGENKRDDRMRKVKMVKYNGFKYIKDVERKNTSR